MILISQKNYQTINTQLLSLMETHTTVTRKHVKTNSCLMSEFDKQTSACHDGAEHRLTIATK